MEARGTLIQVHQALAALATGYTQPATLYAWLIKRVNPSVNLQLHIIISITGVYSALSNKSSCLALWKHAKYTINETVTLSFVGFA